MKKQLLHIILFSIIASIMSSCCETIHEYPDTGTSSVTITMHVKTAGPELYKVVDYSGGGRVTFNAKDFVAEPSRASFLATITDYLAMERLNAAEWDMRMVWELYSGSRQDIIEGNGQLLLRDQQIVEYEDIAMPQHSFDIDIPSGQYTLLAWTDYVPKGTTDDYYFSTDDLNALVCNLELRSACTDNDQRDCFAKAYEFYVNEVEYTGQPKAYETTLIRPQGRYVVLATDYNRYLKLSNTPVEENNVVCHYPSYINIGYSILEERPNLSGDDLYYDFQPRPYDFDGDIMVCTADDYSFVKGEESVISLNMTVIHAEGSEMSDNDDIEIPLYPDKLTVVVGEFLTASNSSGGIKIEDNFEDEIIIRI